MSATTTVGTKTMLAGSPGFQSPEQLRSEGLGHPTDVYALGAVLLVLFGETQVWPGLALYQITYVCSKWQLVIRSLTHTTSKSYLLSILRGRCFSATSKGSTQGYAIQDIYFCILGVTLDGLSMHIIHRSERTFDLRLSYNALIISVSWWSRTLNFLMVYPHWLLKGVGVP